MANHPFHDPVVESTSRLLFYVGDAGSLMENYPGIVTQAYLDSVKQELLARNLPVEAPPVS